MHELAQGVSRFVSLALSVLPWLAIGVVAASIVKTTDSDWTKPLQNCLPPRGGSAGSASVRGAGSPGCR